jgi:BASS family bile acid:Na+ symporter
VVIPHAHAIVELLTMASLTGLLFASGLRLTGAELLASLADRARIARVLAANFVVVPALGVALAGAAGLSRDQSVGILLLAAAPFAPVVPIFTRMALGDLALAASLTALFPVFSSFLTPWVSAVGLKLLPGPGELRFDVGTILVVLLATITLPLVAGVGVRRRSLHLAVRLLRPVEIAAEAVGAVSLAFVTAVEWPSIATTGWRSLLVTGVLFELALVCGYLAGGPSIEGRRVIAFGTSNRNMALAILIAVQSFPGTPAVAAVVANGLLLIGLGLVHTAWWRWRPARLA